MERLRRFSAREVQSGAGSAVWHPDSLSVVVGDDVTVAIFRLFFGSAHKIKFLLRISALTEHFRILTFWGGGGVVVAIFFIFEICTQGRSPAGSFGSGGAF